MIEAAEADGRLKPGGTIVEATAGNTGLGLALVGGRKGYRIVLVVPDKMAREKILHCKAMGAEVVLTRSDVGRGHPDYYQDLAEAITARTPGALFINQFANPGQPASARDRRPAQKSFARCRASVDAVVVGVGSGGTLTGIGRFMAKNSPRDPHDSRRSGWARCLRRMVETGAVAQSRAAGRWRASARILCRRTPILRLVHKAYAISDPDSFAAARDLFATRACWRARPPELCSPLHCAIAASKASRSEWSVLVCDSGAKYLSKVFNPVYAAQEGWDHERHGQVRDVVFSRFPEGEEVVVRPDDPLRTAFMRMRAADVSQLPVVDGDRIVGLVDESDMLGAVLEGSARAFDLPVKEVMVTRLETISADAPIRELVPLFRRGLVAIVMDGSRFLGIATRLDLVNYFRIAQKR